MDTNSIIKKIIYLSSFTILLVGLIIGSVGITPLYRILKYDQTKDLMYSLETNKVIINEHLDKLVDIGKQIASRTKAQMLTDEYLSGKINKQEMQGFLTKILQAAAKSSEGIEGIVRISTKGEVLAQVGIKVPNQYFEFQYIMNLQDFLQGPVKINGTLYLMNYIPVINNKRKIIAIDIISYSMQKIQDIINLSRDEKSFKKILGFIIEDKIEYITNDPEIEGIILQDPAYNTLQKLLVPTINERERGITNGKIGEQNFIIAYSPIPNSQFGLIMYESDAILFAPVKQQIITIVVIIIIITLILIGLFLILLRPLAGKVLMQTDQLNKIIAEKTNSLSIELKSREKIEEELREQNRELHEFSSILSHDLQSPLQCIRKLILRLIPKYDDTKMDKERKWIQHIEQSTTNMEELIKHILKLVNIRETQFTVETIDISGAANHAIEILSEQINQQKATVYVKSTEQVLANKTLIYQVFVNLISNALKYKHPKRKLTIEIDAKEESDHWIISVIDNGQGVKSKHLKDIFFFYRRADQDSTAQGIGIGLVICRKIIDTHGGKIWVESIEGKGSAFFFTLPKLS